MAGTVMVVEDDVCVRELVMEILGAGGFTAVGAQNGQEALQHLRQGLIQPELILLDLMMPVMDGRQFRAEQLNDPLLAHIPVVVMSAADDDEVRAEGRVGKPFEIQAFLDLVARIAPGSATVH